jgi:uncharacterized protein DUF1802
MIDENLDSCKVGSASELKAPGSSSMTGQCQYALKEWLVTIDSLHTRQILLPRKGGIHEQRDGFKVQSLASACPGLGPFISVRSGGAKRLKGSNRCSEYVRMSPRVDSYFKG